jgi:hypothetical protein
MEGAMRDRTGVFVFVAGVVLILASTSLGFYLAHQAEVRTSKPVMSDGDYDARFNAALVAKDHDYLATVNALMWMVFGLGTSLTLLGLRLLTRSNLDFHPSPPIGSIRDVFEKTE